jgi:transcriptional regulator GlxA family with amidase domain
LGKAIRKKRPYDIIRRANATNGCFTFVHMFHISILVLRNAVVASITDPVDVFGQINTFFKDSGLQRPFDVQLVGASKEVKYNDDKYIIRPDKIFEEVKKTDLIIIPSLTGHASSSTYLNKDCAMWIADHYKSGAEVASLSTGAFLLAFTGIMNGKHCTTHWAYANEFKYYYPAVTLVDDKMITDQDGLYSSGGNNAYWNLLIHLVEKYTNRETAIRTAKYFVIDLDKNNQSQFIIFQGLKDHEDEIVLKAQQYIEANYREKITIAELAGHLYITRRTLERNFKKATRNTITEYIQRVKIESTKKQLEIGRKTVNEIMQEVGYSDIQAFRELFNRITGMTPNEYRRKYKKL